MSSGEWVGAVMLAAPATALLIAAMWSEFGRVLLAALALAAVATVYFIAAIWLVVGLLP